MDDESGWRRQGLGWEWGECELLEQLFLAKEWIKRLRHGEMCSKVFDIFHDSYDDESDEKKRKKMDKMKSWGRKNEGRKANEEERLGEPVTPLTSYLVFKKKKLKWMAKI